MTNPPIRLGRLSVTTVMLLMPFVLRLANHQQMLQSRNQLGGMARISGTHSDADIVNDHLADFFRAMFLLQQIPAQRGGRDLRHVFMFRDGRDFPGRQTAKRDAVSK